MPNNPVDDTYRRYHAGKYDTDEQQAARERMREQQKKLEEKTVKTDEEDKATNVPGKVRELRDKSRKELEKYGL